MNERFSYFKVESTPDPKMSSVVFYDRDGAQVAVEQHSTEELYNPVFYNQLISRLNPAALPRPDTVSVGPYMTGFDCWVFYSHGDRCITEHPCGADVLTLESIVAWEIVQQRLDCACVDYDWMRDHADQIAFCVIEKSWWVRAIEWFMPVPAILK